MFGFWGKAKGICRIILFRGEGVGVFIFIFLGRFGFLIFFDVRGLRKFLGRKEVVFSRKFWVFCVCEEKGKC